MNEEIVEQGASPWFADPRSSEYQLYTPIAYHLDVDRFNGFLRDLCEERGISLVNDEIVEIDVAGGRVERLRSESQAYEADLYVDASGFNRVLQDQVGGEFRNFDLPLDSAYNARFDRPLSEVIPATVVESGESGWFWHIDTYDNRDLGYVFSSEHVSEEDALAEFLDFCEGVADVPDDVTAEDVAQFEFNSGYYREPWTENYLVIGNAGGFVEPLESTGLTFNAEAAVRLSNLLSAHGRIEDDAIRETYNSWWQRCWESIYDFIAVHYKFAPGDTEFWRDMQAMDLSPRVERIIEEFDRNGFDTNVPAPTETGTEVEPLLVLRPESFYMLMRNMGAESVFYETNEFEVSDQLKRGVEQARRQRANHVEQNHVTTEQYYRGVLGLD